MKRTFGKYFFRAMFVALLIIIALNYFIQSKNAEIDMVRKAENRMEQLYKSIVKNERELWAYQESLSLDYMVRCRSFAMLIGENPSLLEEDGKTAEIMDRLGVDELTITDEQGIVTYSTWNNLVGMDFHANPLTEDFLEILDNPSIEIVQEVSPSEDNGLNVQYIGVARQDRKGIVCIGISAERLQDAQNRNELSNVMEEIPLNDGEISFAVDVGNNIIISHCNREYVGKDITQIGFEPDYVTRYQNGGNVTIDGVKYYCVMEVFENTAVCIAQEKKILMAQQYPQYIIVFCYLAAVFLAVFDIVNHFLQKNVIDGVLHLMEDMQKIADGNFDTVVRVKGTPEFEKLSEHINLMVKNILNHSGRMARAIDMVDAPIAAFEYFKNAGKVNVSRRFYSIFGLAEDAVYRREKKDDFLQLLNEKMKAELEDNPGIYKISFSENDIHYVRISMVDSETSVLGIAMDVTQSVAREMKITKERDTDPLTGLNNRSSFERKVRKILENEPQGVCAMIMMDLDHFKGINDNHGHAFGDAYLQHAAAQFKKFEGKGFLPGRRSGDEFYAFVYGRDSEKEVEAIMHSLYKELEENKLMFPDGEARSIKVSAGVAFFTPERAEYDKLLEQADQVLYEAKEAGRGCYRVEPYLHNGIV